MIYISMIDVLDFISIYYVMTIVFAASIHQITRHTRYCKEKKAKFLLSVLWPLVAIAILGYSIIYPVQVFSSGFTMKPYNLIRINFVAVIYATMVYSLTELSLSSAFLISSLVAIIGTVVIESLTRQLETKKPAE